jgi:hypothetical protein
MAKQFDQIDAAHAQFIAAQHVYFVATAAPDGRVNLSPKGMDSLIVAAPTRILWLNVTGSGNETAGHLLKHSRMTLMWCSFTTKPLILRAYGTARAVHRNDADWAELSAHFEDRPENRQIFDMTVEMVQSSCGYAVPFMEYRAERDTLRKWSDDRGPDGLRAYWADRNARTIDGMPTGIEAGNLTDAAE